MSTSLYQPLPVLTTKPTAYPGCCLALSTPLLNFFRNILPPSPDVAISVGSGYGLLEALLNKPPYNTNIIGVEVAPSSNKYLPDANHRVVHGSRFLEPLATEATTWLFVYPRRVGLVEEYMAEYGSGKVTRIIWAGPKADWEDYEGCFAGWNMDITSADEVGGRAWELIVVADKLPA